MAGLLSDFVNGLVELQSTLAKLLIGAPFHMEHQMHVLSEIFRKQLLFFIENI